DHPEEAEFGTAEGRQGPPDQRLRGHRLHRRRRAQLAGALGGSDPQRAGQGSSRGGLPPPAGPARYPGRERPQARPVAVWRQGAEVGLRVTVAMPRRREVPKREVLPAPKFHNGDVAKFINVLMPRGKNSTAERIVYGALEMIKSKSGKDPVE